METYNNLSKWQYASNYGGEDFSDHYVVYTQHRDSDTLERSNFRVLVRELEDAYPESTYIARSGHWAVGWVEQLLIEETNYNALALAEILLEKINDYPVLDEFDWSDLQVEEGEIE